MPVNNTRTSSLIGQLLKWLMSLAANGVMLNEYELFRQVVGTSPQLRKRVSAALQAAGAPSLATLTRDQYNALTGTQVEAALAELLAELDLTLEAARELFCVKLKWCERKRGWKGFVGRLMNKVPAKWRGPVTIAGAAAPWIWEAINILISLSPPVLWTIFGVQLSAYLASGALDKLCKCQD